MELDPLIVAFYRDRYREDDRLTRSRPGRLEFVRTQELLRRLLPPAPARVLDVGGGTGVHARWLVDDGYEVHVVDPVPQHVEQALASAGGRFSAAVGDARGLGVLGDADLPDMAELISTGRHTDDPAGFTEAHVHRPPELAAELGRSGLEQVTVVGVEGPAAPALDNAAEEDALPVLHSAVRCARLVETDPALIAASPHLLGAGRVRPEPAAPAATTRPAESSPKLTAPSGTTVRRPLVLTGGPAVGKTTTGRSLAEARPRAAFVDVDDLRQLVVAGHEAWGVPGAAQRALGAANACALARRFTGAGFDVAVADVVTPATAEVYRRELPGCLLVHLTVTPAEARRRAATRPVWLTDEEFDDLHRADAADPPAADHLLDVTGWSPAEQRAAVDALWAATASAVGPPPDPTTVVGP